MIGIVGITPEQWNSYTLHQLELLAKAHRTKEEQFWLGVRNIEFANYNTAFGFNGKKIFREIKKPKDLYELPSDIKKTKTTAVFDLERAENAFNKSNNKPEWLNKN